MWILVCGSDAVLAKEGSVPQVLGELGCATQTCDIWDEVEESAFQQRPPTAIIVDAGRAADAARAALERLRLVKALREVPALVAVEINALQRLDAADGFDDFVLTPIVPAELYLRIRRVEWRRSEFLSQERIKFGPLCIDLAAHEAQLDGRALALTHQEFRLLSFLAARRGRAFRRDELLQEVWGAQYPAGTRTVDIHVRRLRAKLGPSEDLIETVRGVGYRFKAQE